jgi:hypothetical protein
MVTGMNLKRLPSKAGLLWLPAVLVSTAAKGSKRKHRAAKELRDSKRSCMRASDIVKIVLIGIDAHWYKIWNIPKKRV